MIYERRYNGKKPYGQWERIDRETYESLYRAFYPKGPIGNGFQRCVYEYRRRG